MIQKRNAFLENAAFLHDRFAFVPLLYGSLGLSLRLNEPLSVDDIDILIPQYFFTEGWELFCTDLAAAGYTLVDVHEHTFVRDGIAFSYAAIESLSPFAGIPEEEIEVVTCAGIDFRLLTLEQYRRVYQASMQDGYRIHVRQKKDGDKLARIEQVLGRR